MTERRLPMATPAVEVDPSSARLIGTLAAAGALAGLAIVLVFQWAQPRIETYQAAVLADAITEVLAGPARYETVFVEDGRLTRAPAADTAGLDRIWLGWDDAGRPVGVAVVGAEAGFQDVIRLIFGYDPATGDVLGMKVLESKETPGLGDKIEKDSSFVAGFERVASPLLGVKSDRATGADEEVVMITGATISSRAVIDIINHRVEALGAPLRDFWTATVAAGPPDDAAPAGASGPAPAPGGAP